MPSTSFLGIDFVAEAQSQKTVLINEAFDAIDREAQLSRRIQTISGSGTVGSTRRFVFVTGSGSRTITLPAVADLVEGHQVTVKESAGNTGTITIATPGSETVDGAASSNFSGAYAARTVVWNGTSWRILDHGSGGGASLPIEITDVTGLQAALDGKAATSHTHTIAQVTGLQTALDGKAAVSHTHTIAQVTGLQTELDGKAPTSHTHTIAQVTGLQAALDEKLESPIDFGDVNGLQDALDGKSNVGHFHAIDEVTGLEAALDAKLESPIQIGDVEVLQDALDVKSDIGHLHSIMEVTGLQDALDAKLESPIEIADVADLSQSLDTVSNEILTLNQGIQDVNSKILILESSRSQWFFFGTGHGPVQNRIGKNGVDYALNLAGDDYQILRKVADSWVVVFEDEGPIDEQLFRSREGSLWFYFDTVEPLTNTIGLDGDFAIRIVADELSLFEKVSGLWAQFFPELPPAVTYFEDFNNFSLGAGLPTGWAELYAASAVTYSIVAEGGVNVFQIQSNSSATYNQCVYPTASPDTFRDFDLYVVARRTTDDGGTGPMLCVGASGTAGNDTQFRVQHRQSGANRSLRVLPRIAGASISPGSWSPTAQSIPPAAVLNTWYEMRLQLEGTTFRLKAWVEGTTQPLTWGYTSTFGGSSEAAMNTLTEWFAGVCGIHTASLASNEIVQFKKFGVGYGVGTPAPMS